MVYVASFDLTSNSEPNILDYVKYLQYFQVQIN